MKDTVTIGSATVARIAAALGSSINGLGAVLLAASGRNHVWRLPLIGASGPASVIWKSWDEPGALAQAEAQLLAAAAGRPGLQDIVPKALALLGDGVVLSDFGRAPSLDIVLEGGDPIRALTACRRMGKAYARLHDSGPLASVAGQDPVRHVDSRLERIAQASVRLKDETPRAWLWRLDCPIPSRLDISLTALRATWADPGKWLSVTHGDPAPSNVLFPPGRAVLIDFEYAADRHALYDLSAWAVLCPLSPVLLAALIKEYAGARSDGFGMASFDDGWSTMIAVRTMAIMSAISPEVLEHDQSWAPGWSARSALLAALTTTSRLQHGGPALIPFVDACGMLSDVLHKRWPDLPEHPTWKQRAH